MLQEWKLDHKITSFILFYVSVALFLVFAGFYAFIEFRIAITNVMQFKPAQPLTQMLNVPLLLPMLAAFGSALLFKPRQQPSLHGTAHWATLGELKRAKLVPDTKGQQLLLASPSEAGHNGQSQAPESLLLIGYRGRYPVALTERQQESHVLIVAPTGKRKSSGFFIPALLAERGHRSMLINDVKGELFSLCGGAMTRYHNVLLFSPTRPESSNRYNPLAHIQSSKDARDFARAWVDNTGLSREEFYNVASRTLIAALVLHLIDTEQRPALSRLADLVATKTLDEIKTLLLSSQSGRARNTAGAFLQTIEANPKLSSGVMLGVANRFSILIDSPEYRQVTAADDVDFRAMIDGARPTALFLNVPASATDDLKPLTALLTMQLMNYLTRRAEQEQGGRLPRPFALYLDEFANAGRIPDIEKHISLVRGAGIAIISAVQDFGQIDRVYGRDIADTFLSNFTSQIVLPGLGQREAEYYSKKLGFSTVAATSYSSSTTDRTSRTSTTTVSEAQRPLLLPDEIRTMPVGSFIMIRDNTAPVRGVFRTYIERPELQELLNVRVRRVVRVLEEKPGEASNGQPEPGEEQAGQRPADSATMPPPETL